MQSHPPYQDQGLLARLAADDKQAFAEIYHQYWELLLGMAYNRLKDLQAAEDIVHDVLASLWHNRHTQEIHALKSYLATAVKYSILKQTRKAALRQHYQQREVHQHLYVVSPDTSSLDNKRIIEMLQKEINTLPEKCRLIFRYSREEGMSVRQIAVEMQISSKTVENQLNKALNKLRLTLKKHALFFSGWFL